MRFLLEYDGPIVDLQPAYYHAHRNATQEVGWAALDVGRFWRALRKQGAEANVLPGARPGLLKAYLTAFAESVESDNIIAHHQVRPELIATLKKLRGHGSVQFVTLGANAGARQAVLDKAGVSQGLPPLIALNPDPRRRPGELALLTAQDKRSLVVAAGDALIRSAGTDLIAVGISNGPCIRDRLFQAGASAAYRDLDDFVEALKSGAPDLVKAGLLPPSYDPPGK